MTQDQLPEWVQIAIGCLASGAIAWAKFRADLGRHEGMATTRMDAHSVRLDKLESNYRDAINELHRRIDELKDNTSEGLQQAAAQAATMQAMREDVGEIKQLLASTVGNVIRAHASGEWPAQGGHHR